MLFSDFRYPILCIEDLYMGYYRLISKLRELCSEIERSSLIISQWKNIIVINLVKAIKSRMRCLKDENQLWETIGDHY